MKKKGCLTWLVIAVAIVVALAFVPGGEPEEFEVATEFELEPIIHLPSIGPVDLSVNKAVIYLWLTVGVIAIGTVILNRSIKNPTGRVFSTFEGLYDLARLGIVNSVMRKGQTTWFPYVAGVFIFILVSNFVGLIPLPFGHHHQLAFYGATANLFVTISLASCTFVLTHYAGIRTKGVGGYVKGWIVPAAPPVLKQMLFFLEILSEIFRLVSLAVRLFANMLAGHVFFAVFFTLAVMFQSYLLASVLQGASVVMYLFEVFVAFIQAFIFAILSAIYIGGAMEESH